MKQRSFCRRPPPCEAAETPVSPGAYSAAACLWHGTHLLCKSSELSDLSRKISNNKKDNIIFNKIRSDH